MKKVLMVLNLCLVSAMLWAQSSEDKDGFNLPNGIRFGYQSSNYFQDGESIGDNLDRGYLGYVRKVTLAHFLKLETGLEYMIAGANVNEDTRVQLHYLVIPAQGAFKLGPFVAQAGVSANLRLAETYTVDGETIDRSDDEKSNGFDVAANIGAGFNFLFMTIEARHYWGLLEVEDGWHNDYWQLGLKFNF